MKRCLWFLLACLASPVVAQPLQVVDCPACVLGLYDQPQMLTNYGSVQQFVSKDIYLGIQLGSGLQGLTRVELSIAGLRAMEDGMLVTGVQSLTTPPFNIAFGAVSAPADTSATSVQTGGLILAWPGCVAGSLAKISFLPLRAVTNKVFRVMHNFPPSSSAFGLAHPIIIECDNPIFTPVRVTGGCYIANWDGSTPLSCLPNDIPIAVTPAGWGAVKALYR